jgi:hypothetical protein
MLLQAWGEKEKIHMKQYFCTIPSNNLTVPATCFEAEIKTFVRNRSYRTISYTMACYKDS